MKKKGKKKMPILRQEVIDNPIPTSCDVRCCDLSSDCITSIHKQQNNYISGINKDVGMELSMTSCLSIGIFFFPFFFMK